MPVVFDIGGVIFEDVWERIFFQQTVGLSDLFDLNLEQANKVCIDSWGRFSVTSLDAESWETLEVNYWSEILSNLQIPWSIQECIEYSQKFITPIPGIGELIALIDESHIQIGVCSNHTAFWFERQMAVSRGLRLINRSNMVLSFEQGCTKDQKNYYLFHKVVDFLNCRPEEVIYIEDRLKHQQSAEKFGFRVIPFNRDEPNLLSTIRKRLELYGVLLQEKEL